jgi:N-formylglutamate amidohydrolase
MSGDVRIAIVDALIQTGGGIKEGLGALDPVLIRRARGHQTPVIVACPHSGRFYPEDLVHASSQDAFTLRRSEDAFVDELFAHAPKMGADLLINRFARAYVDVNRCASELDYLLIEDLPSQIAAKQSERVKAGLGVIPRTLGDGINIYRKKMSLRQAQNRLEEVYEPWHCAIETHLAHKCDQFGVALFLDCHSMPNAASGDPSVDIVLGDRFGASCSPHFINEAAACVRECGFKLGRNDPYAGGYSTIRHTNLVSGRHSLQIEINRSLYMVEGALTRRPCFDDIAQAMTKLIGRLSDVALSLREKNAINSYV